MRKGSRREAGGPPLPGPGNGWREGGWAGRPTRASAWRGRCEGALARGPQPRSLPVGGGGDPHRLPVPPGLGHMKAGLAATVVRPGKPSRQSSARPLRWVLRGGSWVKASRSSQGRLWWTRCRLSRGQGGGRRQAWVPEPGKHREAPVQALGKQEAGPSGPPSRPPKPRPPSVRKEASGRSGSQRDRLVFICDRLMAT